MCSPCDIDSFFFVALIVDYEKENYFICHQINYRKNQLKPFHKVTNIIQTQLHSKVDLFFCRYLIVELDFYKKTPNRNISFVLKRTVIPIVNSYQRKSNE
jgi:hypothetical protein